MGWKSIFLKAPVLDFKHDMNIHLHCSLSPIARVDLQLRLEAFLEKSNFPSSVSFSTINLIQDFNCMLYCSDKTRRV